MSKQDWDRIPLSQPWFQGNELAYLTDCIEQGWVSSAGAYVKNFEQAIADYTGSSYAVAVTSGTAALHLSLILADVQAGDLVLIPNLSFVASANAVRYVGADPVLVDVCPDTWQIDGDLVKTFLKQACTTRQGQCYHNKSQRRIKAIMPVHVLGYLADIPHIASMAQEFHLQLIEDAAEALGSWEQDRHAGTMGDLGCLSFNGNKIITTGGGGMILTQSESLAQRARHLSTQAKSHPDRYDHDQIGYNYRMSNVHAAIGLAQMERFEEIRRRKADIESRYRSALLSIEDGLSFPTIRPLTLPNHWLPTIYSQKSADIRAALSQAHIQTRPLWTAMNRLPMFQDCLYISREDHAGRIVENSVSLPAYVGMEVAQQERVIEMILSSAV